MSRAVSLLLLLGACGKPASVVHASSVPQAAGQIVPPAAALPTDAKPVRIHWSLKLPEPRTEGDYVMRDDASFASWVGDRKYVTWNSLDFKRQMAIVVARSYTSSGWYLSIQSIWETAKEILVFVNETGPALGEITCPLCTNAALGVAVNRSDLPVRFERTQPRTR